MGLKFGVFRVRNWGFFMVDQGWLGACGFSGEFGAFWVRNLGFLGQKFGIFYDGLGVDAACGFWGEIGAFWVTNLGFLGSEIWDFLWWIGGGCGLWVLG